MAGNDRKARDTFDDVRARLPEIGARIEGGLSDDDDIGTLLTGFRAARKVIDALEACREAEHEEAIRCYTCLELEIADFECDDKDRLIHGLRFNLEQKDEEIARLKDWAEYRKVSISSYISEVYGND